MKILVLNCGSSSIKYALYDMDDHSVVTSGGIEKIGLSDSFIKIKVNGKKIQMDEPVPEHTAGVQLIFRVLTQGENAVLNDLHELDAVGHRMVHGGERFSESVLITDEVMRDFSACNDLAPLHNPANIKGVNAVKALLPEIPQVGVFDTAFHQTMPDYAYMYATPYELYEKYGVRRYGFHGTSHRYVSQRVLDYLGIDKAEGTKIITCHIGNGASIAAVKDGKCVDTSMGLTPLEGLIMGTRSGDLDPAILQFISNKENLSIDEMLNVLNKKSGVLGLSGVSSDFRDLGEAAGSGNEQAKTTLETYYYRVAKYIGSYVAAMNGVDAIVFTAGVGENNIEARQVIGDYLGYLGTGVDRNKNNIRGEEAVISSDGSKVDILVIPTNEELAIARETVKLV